MRKSVIASISLIAIVACFLIIAEKKETNEHFETKGLNETNQIDAINEEKIAKYLRDNSCLFSYAFETYRPYDVSKDYQQTKDKLEFIHAYNHIFQEAKEIYKLKDSPEMENVFIKEEDIKMFQTRFFADKTINLENVDNLKDFFKIGAPPDGGLPLYYPVLYQMNYEADTNIYTISMIDYRSIDPTLKDYNTINIVDDIGTASILKIKVKQVGEKIKLLESEFQYKEDLSMYDSIEYRQNNKIEQKNDGIYDSDILKEKNKLANFIKQNGTLIGTVFQTYKRESFSQDFSKFEEQINFIMLLTQVITSEEDDILYDSNVNQPTADMYLKKDYLIKLATKIFEDFETESLKKLEANYYDVGVFPDGGCPNYYPVFHKVEYEKDGLFTLTILDYQDIDSKENYNNVNHITEKELEEKGLKDKISILKIKYKKEGNNRKIISANFHYKK